ncbi:MAG: protein kinase [Endozoicomonadaceae bacterium]|nr:protein kinase [Endozoicomonadaceae bacterium]MCY4329627.1 protein kinase [Endozoicomonadaceae bacterium]
MKINKNSQTSHTQQTTDIKPSWKRYGKRFVRFMVTIYSWVQHKLGKSHAPDLDIVRKIKPQGRRGKGIYKIAAYQQLRAYEFGINNYEGAKKGAQILSRLSHPNIIKAYNNPENKTVVMTQEEGLNSKFEATSFEGEAEDIKADLFHEWPTGLYMELAGGDLDKKMCALSRAECYKAALDLLSAATYLHNQSVCHMDIKPQNILWMGNKAVLTDFDGAMTGTESGKIWINNDNIRETGVTLDYISPELIYAICSEQPYSINGAAYDVWTIGCCIAELLTGSELFPVEKGGILSREYYPFQEKLDEFLKVHDKKLGPEIISVLKEMLQINPDKRITASEALKRLSANYPLV